MTHRRLRRSARALLAAGLALALAAPASAGMKLPGGGGFSVSGKKGPFLKQVAGRDLAAGGGAGSMGLAADSSAKGEFRAARLRMPATEAAVADFVAKLDAQWPYAKGGPVRIYILGLDNYGAESMPDGSIVIPFGLIDQAQSDDELAFVLGHELGHIRLNHFGRNARLQEQKQASGQMVDVFVTGAAMIHGGGISNPVVDAAATRGNAMNDAARLFLQTLVEPNWSRDEEDEADATGFDLSNADSYDSEGASATVFDKLQADADRRAALSDALAKGIQDSMTSTLTASNVSSVALGGGAGLAGGVKQGLISGAGHGLMAWMAAGDQQKHRAPAARKKGIADYSNDAYPAGLPLRDEQHIWLDQVRASKEYLQAKLVVEAVRASLQARADNKPDVALGEIDKALHTTFKTSALVSNEAGRAWADKGDFARAEQYFAVADQSPDQTIDGYRDHARMLIRAGQYAKARAVADAGTTRFEGDDKPFLPALILISFNTDQHDAGVAYLQRCVGYDDQALKNECGLAATNPSDSRQYDSLSPAEKAKVDQAVTQASNTKAAPAAKPSPLNVLSGLGHLKIPGT